MNRKENFYAKRFGTRLKVFREKKGLTQTDLSNITGLTQPVIARLEAGKIKNPRPSTTEPIYKALELSESDIKSLFSDVAFEIKKDDEKVDVRITVPFLLKTDKKEAIDTIDRYVSSIDDDEVYLLAQFAQALYANEHPEESNKSFREFATVAKRGDAFDVGENVDTDKAELEAEDSYKQIRTYIRNKTYDVNFKYDDYYYLPDINEAYKFNADMDRVAKLIKDNSFDEKPSTILLVGEYGSGKSTFAKTIANVCNLPYREQVCDPTTRIEEFEGDVFYDENGSHYKESEFMKIYQNGGIINIVNYNQVKDFNTLEKFRDAYTRLGIFTKSTGEIVRRNKNCVIIFTVEAPLNETNMPIKRSFRNDMDIVINLTIPSRDLLISRIMKETKLDEDTIDKLVRCFLEVRKYLENEGEYEAKFSQRELVDWASDIKDGNNPYESFKENILPSLSYDKDIKEEVLKLVKIYFN